MRGDRERLLDILEAIEKIEKYAARGRHVFEQDELVQIWTIHHLEIIGEATRSLSPELRTRHSGGPWTKIVGMRNVLAHRYFGIDPEAVWTVIDQDLPALKREVEAILREAEKA